ncbi:sensor histidine kinase [Candidimonas nitroreducens]|uniref:sensor histidine kinase n=1 Tax=Candidimonas nitroreducens TaxID=683354 RepID=UPI0013034FE5|nr:7TM-DISM domain-containing protein [Candidimonas nitroreducens]
MPIDHQQPWPAGALQQVRVYEDRSATLDIRQIASLAEQHPQRFIPATSTLLHPGRTASAWWLEFDLANTDIVPLQLRLVMGPPNIQWVDFYLERNGRWQHYIAGESIPLESQSQPGRLPTLGFGLAAGQKVRIFARVQALRPLRIQPHVYLESDFQRHEAWNSIWIGFLLGEFGALGIAALFVALFAASPAFACLGLLSLSSLLYEATVRGYAKLYLWPDATQWAERAANMLGCLSLSMFVLFFYMLARQESVKLPARRYFLGLIIAEGLIAGFSAVSDAPFLGLIIAISSVLIGVSLMAAAYVLSKRADPYGKFAFWFAVFFLLHLALRVVERRGLVAGVLSQFDINNVATNPIVSLTGTCINFILLASWITQVAKQRQAARHALEEFRESEHQRLQAEVDLQTQALNSALKYADDKNRQQTEMLGYISHDLRAPLGTIVSYARLLRETQTSVQAPYIRTIERSANYQLGLIGDLLEYAKGELQPLQITPCPTRMDELLQDVHQHGVAMSAQQDNRYVSEAPGELPACIMVDARRIKQILYNLLSNAAKFTHNGTIRLQALARRESNRWALSFIVADSGIGMEPNVQAGLFQAFSPVHPHSGGAGLGLFIAKHIVEQMGGKLLLESAPDIGSRFSVHITVQADDPETIVWQPETPPTTPAPEPARQIIATDMLPPARRRLELAILAHDGQLSSIEDWIEQTAADHPDSAGYVEQIKAALLVLDFPGIETLALSAVGTAAADY